MDELYGTFTLRANNFRPGAIFFADAPPPDTYIKGLDVVDVD